MKLTEMDQARRMDQMILPPPVRTLLDIPAFEYRDSPWQPRGDKVHNGFRRDQPRGIRL